MPGKRSRIEPASGEGEIIMRRQRLVLLSCFALAIILTPRILRGDESVEEWLPADAEERLGLD